VAGFTSKWYLALGSMDIHNTIILSVLIISSLLNAGYFAPIVYTAFFGERPAGETAVGSLETQPLILLMVVPLFITSIVSVAIGVYPNLLLNIAKLMGGV
jgi:multicomponent Na+:H+ antiporter subunit D